MDESKIFRYTVYGGAILLCLAAVWFLLGIPGGGDGGFDRIFTTNLVYQTPELLQREWYCTVKMGRYIAALVDQSNRGNSLHDLTKPAFRIQEMLELYRNKG